jgi:hypothetical protein
MTAANNAQRKMQPRVKLGAKFLDENVPGWDKRININTLRLSSGKSCICGQVFRKRAWYWRNKAKKKSKTFIANDLNGYDYALNHLFAEANSWVEKLVPKGFYGRALTVGRVLGFDVYQDEYYSDLQKVWVDFLKERAAAT